MITKIGHHCYIEALVSQGALNTWKTLDWAHNICVKGKLKTNRGPNILRAQNIVGQKGRLKTIYGQNILNQILPISSKPLDSQPSLVSRWRQKKGNANFENHMWPKCPRSCLVAQKALMNSMCLPSLLFQQRRQLLKVQSGQKFSLLLLSLLGINHFPL